MNAAEPQQLETSSQRMDTSDNAERNHRQQHCNQSKKIPADEQSDRRGDTWHIQDDNSETSTSIVPGSLQKLSDQEAAQPLKTKTSEATLTTGSLLKTNNSKNLPCIAEDGHPTPKDLRVPKTKRRGWANHRTMNRSHDAWRIKPINAAQRGVECANIPNMIVHHILANERSHLDGCPHQARPRKHREP